LLPRDALFGVQQLATPVRATRTVDGVAQARQGEPGHEFAVGDPGMPVPAGAERVPLLLIDGNRDGRLVLFHHDGHVERLGLDACGDCHHQNLPFDRSTSCYQCHRDMYTPTDIFDHGSHARRLGGNAGCSRCHADGDGAKTRATATACDACHRDMVVAGSVVLPRADGLLGLAPGYMDAMHGLCVTCHTQQLAAGAVAFDRRFAECAFCHRDIDGTHFQRMAPYADSNRLTAARSR
jgi:hypothetical protein